MLDDFYATIAQELSTSCESQGYQLALSIANDDRDSELKHIDKFVAARVAGIIIVPTASPRPETVRLLSAIPHVQLLRQSRALHADWFGINDEEALEQATRFALENGHRRIAYVGAAETLPTGRNRLAGFRRELALRHLSPSQSSIKLGTPSADFGLRATEELLKRKQRPTAMVFGSVPTTLGALEAIHRAPVRVPADISIVGFGDPPWFAWWRQGFRQGLTTVRLPIRELAQACGSYFLNRLDAGAASSSSNETPYEVGRDATLVVVKMSGRLCSGVCRIAQIQTEDGGPQCNKRESALSSAARNASVKISRDGSSRWPKTRVPSHTT